MKTDHQLDINQVWEQFHKTRDDYHRNLLMEHYRDIVKYSAERLHSKLPDKVELDDLISAGIFGLMDAIDAYDPSRGVKFETYCAPRIKGSILDELRSMDWVPRLVRARAHQLARATHSLELHLGRKPVEEEIAGELNMDMEEFNRLQRDANAASLVSLNTKYGDDDGEKDVCEIDIIKDQKSEDPLLEAQKRDLKNLLTKGLTRAERLIIVLYYYEEMTMKEIGATLDLSESRVSQMHSSIVARLKAQLDTRKKEFSVG
jgi:RNA polymerase sigma factor for flagellar operon FliA